MWFDFVHLSVPMHLQDSSGWEGVSIGPECTDNARAYTCTRSTGTSMDHQRVYSAKVKLMIFSRRSASSRVRRREREIGGGIDAASRCVSRSVAAYPGSRFFVARRKREFNYSSNRFVVTEMTCHSAQRITCQGAQYWNNPVGVRPSNARAAVVVAAAAGSAAAAVVALFLVVSFRAGRSLARFSFSRSPARPTRGESITVPARSTDDFVAFLSDSLTEPRDNRAFRTKIVWSSRDASDSRIRSTTSLNKGWVLNWSFAIEIFMNDSGNS